PLRPSDFASRDDACRSEFIEALGNAFVDHGYVLLTDGSPGEETQLYYEAAARVLTVTPEETLRNFEFVNQGIEPDYFSNPCGAQKPGTVSIKAAPQYVAAAGLSFVFESNDGGPTVTVSGTDGEVRVSLPSVADGEVKVEHQGRSLRFHCIDSSGIYQVFAPD